MRTKSLFTVIVLLCCSWAMSAHAKKPVKAPSLERNGFSLTFPKSYISHKGHLFKTEMIGVSLPQDKADTTHVAVRWVIQGTDKPRGQNLYAWTGVELDNDLHYTDEWLIPINNGKGKGKMIKKMEGLPSQDYGNADYFVYAKACFDFNKGGTCSVKFKIKEKKKQ